MTNANVINIFRDIVMGAAAGLRESSVISRSIVFNFLVVDDTAGYMAATSRLKGLDTFLHAL